MEIIIYNSKGGVGKTTFAIQIATYFDATIIEVDPYGVLTQTLGNDRVYKVGLNENLPEIREGDVVYDFGGFDDARLDIAAKNANLIIIPFNPTINALGTTLKSYERAKSLDLPILFIANAVVKDQDAADAIDYIQEVTKDEVDCFIVPHTRAIQTAENEGVGIIDLANSSGLKRHTYKKISTTMQELMSKIKEYL